jgi:ABC-type transport system substrate-binding protein
MFDSQNAGTGFNWGQIKDPKIDELLQQGQSEVDEAKRLEIYAELQEYIMNQAYWGPLNVWALAHIHPTSLEGVQASYKEARFAYIYDAHFAQ